MPARKNDLSPEERVNLQQAGAKLRKLRDARSLSGDQVGEMTGIGKQQVSNLELGKIGRPSMFHLVALGKLYNKTPNEIARMYGYWDGPEGPSRLPGVNTALRRLEVIAQNLSPEHRERWLATVEVAAITKLADMHYDDDSLTTDGDV
jgi:transcriptional regulator with XRE-family HTH domain